MDMGEMVPILLALGHETRLKVLGLLAKHGSDGLPAGSIAAELDVKQNTMSSQLKILSQAGLVEKRREGREIIYRVAPRRVSALIGDLKTLVS